MTTPTLADLAHLEWARKLGRRGWGQVQPNPLVGCVIVNDDRTVGEGHHAAFGGPHAEIVALEEAKSRAQGATVYVSLEPCNHHGKTPPCSEALLAAGVRRVVYGARDPDPAAGGGGDALKARGVEVVGPVWPDRVGRAENPAHFHTKAHASPYVALKLAMSLDARLAPARSQVGGGRHRVTGLEAEREVHRLRTGFDAVMVGAGTAHADDPRLTVRLVPPGRLAPRRIVLDPDARLPVGAALFQDIADAPLHVFVREEAPEGEIERLEQAGAHVHPVPSSPAGLAMAEVTAACWDLGIQSILCEGGAKLADTLLRERLAQRLYLFVAPTTFGETGVAAFPPDADSLRWQDFEAVVPPQLFGRDTLMVLDRQGG
ncbi:MAG: bifunctional diaminohydroxyphosphoribosylaminopyrimidine deaminase/5-amino-6-(5-phosphoribosylamino)uracil reductase RibD [Gemmatimonadales bacterium]